MLAQPCKDCHAEMVWQSLFLRNGGGGLPGRGIGGGAERQKSWNRLGFYVF